MEFSHWSLLSRDQNYDSNWRERQLNVNKLLALQFYDKFLEVCSLQLRFALSNPMGSTSASYQKVREHLSPMNRLTGEW